MGSVIGRLVKNAADVRVQTPVPFASAAAAFTGLWAGGGRSEQLKAPGSVGTVYAITSANAEGTSSVDWHLYRRAPSGLEEDRVEVTAHAALDLWNRPNRFYTRSLLVEAFTQHIDCVGEGWIVIGRSPMSTIPLEMWIVRPDRIRPIPDPDLFIAGYVYTGPNGEQIPLEVDEVIRTIIPNPEDPYRGLGPIQSVLTELDSSRYSAEWNRNFFLNSAEPGGVIQVDRELSDSEWERLRMRWNEQHRGVSRAHRVAILENATWVDRKFTQKDMQFVELRNASREVIREAFRFPLPMLGTTENANRANTEAAEVIFARHILVPRLCRIRDMLNTYLLPMFGDHAAATLEFDFDSPVPEDVERDNATRESRVKAFRGLVGVGVDSSEAAAWCGLPDFTVEERAMPDLLGRSDPLQLDDSSAVHPRPRGRRTRSPRNTTGDIAEEDLPDLGGLQASWEDILTALLVAWSAEVVAGWIASLVEQVGSLATYLHGLPSMRVSSVHGSDLLLASMVEAGASGADSVVREASEQSVDLSPVRPRTDDLRDVSDVTVDLLGREMAISAAREALRTDGDVDAVRAKLESLTDARPALYLGGALTQAQHRGRLATFSAGPPVSAYYACEILDTNTCPKCRDVHRKWLGNDLHGDVAKTYPTGGYIWCEGRQRCRGQVVATWRAGADHREWLEMAPITEEGEW